MAKDAWARNTYCDIRYEKLDSPILGSSVGLVGERGGDVEGGIEFVFVVDEFGPKQP